MLGQLFFDKAFVSVFLCILPSNQTNVIMKNVFFILSVALLLQACATNASIFELSPQQSMSITGKGPGQDAAYNPYGATKSVSVVQNLGDAAFFVRIQTQGTITENVEIQPRETKEFVLAKGYELYLDSDAVGKAKVTFRKFK